MKPFAPTSLIKSVQPLVGPLSAVHRPNHRGLRPPTQKVGANTSARARCRPSSSRSLTLCLSPGPVSFDDRLNGIILRFLRSNGRLPGSPETVFWTSSTRSQPIRAAAYPSSIKHVGIWCWPLDQSVFVGTLQDDLCDDSHCLEKKIRLWNCVRIIDDGNVANENVTLVDFLKDGLSNPGSAGNTGRVTIDNCIDCSVLIGLQILCCRCQRFFDEGPGQSRVQIRLPRIEDNVPHVSSSSTIVRVA